MFKKLCCIILSSIILITIASCAKMSETEQQTPSSGETMKKTVPNVPLWDDKGFKMESLEYHEYPAMRFVGVSDGNPMPWEEIDAVLDTMTKYHSEFNYPVFLWHWNGLTTDVQPFIGVFGRFMKADTPVPEGFVSVDFVTENDSKAGPPYLSRFAIAVFSGDMKAMHCDTKGQMQALHSVLGKDGQDVMYPDKFFVGEVFFNGPNDWSTGFLSSIK